MADDSEHAPSHLPSAENLLNAAAILQQCMPADIDGDLNAQPELLALRTAGKALFSRYIMNERFGQKDAVEFLKQQSGHQKMLRKLEKLQKVVSTITSYSHSIPSLFSFLIMDSQ